MVRSSGQKVEITNGVEQVGEAGNNRKFTGKTLTIIAP